MDDIIRPYSFEENGGSNSERDRKLLDDGYGRVAGTAFDVADVGAMNAGLVREGLLAQPFLITQAAQVLTKALAYIHACLKARPSPIDLQTMSDIQVDCAAKPRMVMSLIVDRDGHMAQHVSGLIHSATRHDGYSFRPSALPGSRKRPRSFFRQTDAKSGETNEARR